MSSRREGSRGQMKLEDPPPVRNHYDITGNFDNSVGEVGGEELERSEPRMNEK